MVTNWAVSEIDLSDAGFWGRPFDERDAAFGVLRRERPVAFVPEPALPLLPPGPAINGIKHLPVRFTPSRRGG
jgi:methyl-branched lipid omega-hydroxylase